MAHALNTSSVMAAEATSPTIERPPPRPFAFSVSLARAEVPQHEVNVQTVMSRSFVELPAWFPVHKAASVLRGLGREFALTSDSRGQFGVASLADLTRAPADKTTQWCATPVRASVTPLESVSQAWRLMIDLRTEKLPVKVGELIVGVVTSSALREARARAGATGSDRPLPATMNEIAA